MPGQDYKQRDKPKIYWCSFCGKTQHEVQVMIAGPTVFICDECTDSCLDLINFNLTMRFNKYLQKTDTSLFQAWEALEPKSWDHFGWLPVRATNSFHEDFRDHVKP